MNTLNTMLVDSCINGNLYSVKELIKEGADINYNNNQPFYEASNNSHIDIMEYLLDNGVDMDTTNDNEFSIEKYKVNIFYNICKKGNLEAIKFLDNKVNLIEFKCCSLSLWYAIESNNIDLVKYMCINNFMIVIPSNENINEEMFEYIYNYTLHNNSLKLSDIYKSIKRDTKEKWLNKLNEFIDNDTFKLIYKYDYNNNYDEKLNYECYNIMIVLINNNNEELFTKFYNYIKNILKKEINFDSVNITNLMCNLYFGSFKDCSEKKKDLNKYEKYYDLILNKNNIYSFLSSLLREEYYDDLIKFNNKYNSFITDEIKNKLLSDSYSLHKYDELNDEKLNYILKNLNKD